MGKNKGPVGGPALSDWRKTFLMMCKELLQAQ